MSIYFDITSSDSAYKFLLDVLGFTSEKLIMDFLVECEGDLDAFWEKNNHYFKALDVNDVRFVAFHVTASLDDCREIKKTGLNDLQYVLSHNTMLSKVLKQGGIQFDIDNYTLLVDDNKFNINYDYYKGRRLTTQIEKTLENIAHRIYYDFCVDGFWVNDNIDGYGTDIHERPEFISKLIKLSPKAKSIDTFWRTNSKSYKIFFYATVEQIHKFTFDMEKNFEPYTEEEQEVVKKWMFYEAVDQAFNPGGEKYIYIRDHQHIPPEQIIRCEVMERK